MNFTKVQGAGNDFVLIEAKGSLRNWSRTAIAMCDRHFGVGADGLLLLLPSKEADFRMRMFNPDGSEAEACGNGLRCLAKYILYRGLAKAKEIKIETMAGLRQVRFRRSGKEVTGIQVSMGKPAFGAKDIPVAVEKKLLDIKPILDYPITIDGWRLKLDFVSMGNPHAVYFWEKPLSEFPLTQLGSKVEHHRLFPNRVNFEVARVINRQEIEMGVWERGAGETLACGTGACAVAVAAQLHDYVDKKVDLKLPGGTLNVEWDGVGEVFLGGQAEVVFTGEWIKEKHETG